ACSGVGDGPTRYCASESVREGRMSGASAWVGLTLAGADARPLRSHRDRTPRSGGGPGNPPSSPLSNSSRIIGRLNSQRGMRLPFVVDLERSPSSSSFRHCGRRDCVLAVLGSFYYLDCHAASPLDRVREGGVSTTLRFVMVATFVLIGFL